LGSPDERIRRLEELRRSGKISEELYRELRGKYEAEATGLARRVSERREKGAKERGTSLGKLIPAVALMVIVVGGAVYALRGRSGLAGGGPTPTSTEAGEIPPELSPTSPPGPGGQAGGGARAGAVTFEQALGTAASAARSWCPDSYPIEGTLPWMGRDSTLPGFRGLASEWTFRFFCPGSRKTATFRYVSGSVEQEEILGEREFEWSPDFTPQPLSPMVSGTSAFAIAYTSGGRQFVQDHLGETVYVFMAVAGSDVGRYYGWSNLYGWPGEVSSEEAWVVIFALGGGGEAYGVCLDADTGEVLVAEGFTPGG